MSCESLGDLQQFEDIGQQVSQFIKKAIQESDSIALTVPAETNPPILQRETDGTY